MRAMELRNEWSPDNLVLGERPVPAAGPGQVLIRMRAASLNYRDTVMARRGYGRRSGNLPLVLCSDGAGTVEAVGAGVSRVKPGDLVCPIFSLSWLAGPFREENWATTLGGPLDGTLQDYLCVPEHGVVKAPAHMSAAEAATLPCAAVTAWNAVVTQGQVKAGDLVLVQGTGGVSLFALLFAKLLGAETILTSSSEEKLARGKAMGADHLINYKTTPDWAKAAREAGGGRGVDHVVEVGGSGTLEQSIRAVRPSGVISLIGVLAGAVGELNLGPVVTQNIRLQGITVGSRAVFEDMNRALALHKVRPPIDAHRYALEEFPAALKRFPLGRHFGKVVIEL
jgi:NADPH:quinone reductase-like Zn-dependent oxidoreductase